jgi:MoxR-like ATPase
MTDQTIAASIPLSQRLNDEVLQPMKDAFVGKDEVIDLLGVCLVGGENLFILGPPGTAKSALVQDLSRRIEGRVFDYLLTRFTEPNEIFGPFDIRKLRDGDLVTNTEGMLPEASFVFLDELLNANSAILNSLLMVLNERIFRRGREVRKLPTLMVVGASNRLPEDDALGRCSTGSCSACPATTCRKSNCTKCWGPVGLSTCRPAFKNQR